MFDAAVLGDPLVPAEEVLVKFYEDEIPVVRLADGRLYVPIPPIAVALGLSSNSQRRRVLRDEIMAEAVTNIVSTAPDSKKRGQYSIPLEVLPGFLFGLDTSRVKPELRDKITRYRRECFRALWQAVSGNYQLPRPANESKLVSPVGESRAEQTLQYAAAIYELAATQVDQERRLTGLEERHQTVAEYVRGFIQQTRSQLSDHEGRLSTLEARHVTITDHEAAEIAIAVKNLAYELELRGTANGYARVYGVLHRKYGVRSYPLLPHSKYETVLGWLREWYDEVVAKPLTKELTAGSEDGNELAKLDAAQHREERSP